jgi:ATP synthase protein I
MNEQSKTDSSEESNPFSKQIAAQAARKLKAKRTATRSIWFGLGMSGLIGWSVMVPTLIGIAIGIWVDKHYPSRYSWTLMLMLIGLIVGCANAWHWVDSEHKDMQEESDE